MPPPTRLAPLCTAHISTIIDADSSPNITDCGPPRSSFTSRYPISTNSNPILEEHRQVQLNEANVGSYYKPIIHCSYSYSAATDGIFTAAILSSEPQGNENRTTRNNSSLVRRGGSEEGSIASFPPLTSMLTPLRVKHKYEAVTALKAATCVVEGLITSDEITEQEHKLCHRDLTLVDKEKLNSYQMFPIANPLNKNKYYLHAIRCQNEYLIPKGNVTLENSQEEMDETGKRDADLHAYAERPLLSDKGTPSRCEKLCRKQQSEFKRLYMGGEDEIIMQQYMIDDNRQASGVDEEKRVDRFRKNTMGHHGMEKKNGDNFIGRPSDVGLYSMTSQTEMMAAQQRLKLMKRVFRTTRNEEEFYRAKYCTEVANDGSGSKGDEAALSNSAAVDFHSMINRSLMLNDEKDYYTNVLAETKTLSSSLKQKVMQTTIQKEQKHCHPLLCYHTTKQLLTDADRLINAAAKRERSTSGASNKQIYEHYANHMSNVTQGRSADFLVKVDETEASFSHTINSTPYTASMIFGADDIIFRTSDLSSRVSSNACLPPSFYSWFPINYSVETGKRLGIDCERGADRAIDGGAQLAISGTWGTTHKVLNKEATTSKYNSSIASPTRVIPQFVQALQFVSVNTSHVKKDSCWIFSGAINSVKQWKQLLLFYRTLPLLKEISSGVGSESAFHHLAFQNDKNFYHTYPPKKLQLSILAEERQRLFQAHQETQRALSCPPVTGADWELLLITLMAFVRRRGGHTFTEARLNNAMSNIAFDILYELLMPSSYRRCCSGGKGLCRVAGKVLSADKIKNSNANNYGNNLHHSPCGNTSDDNRSMRYSSNSCFPAILAALRRVLTDVLGIDITSDFDSNDDGVFKYQPSSTSFLTTDEKKEPNEKQKELKLAQEEDKNGKKKMKKMLKYIAPPLIHVPDFIRSGFSLSHSLSDLSLKHVYEENIENSNILLRQHEACFDQSQCFSVNKNIHHEPFLNNITSPPTFLLTFNVSTGSTSSDFIPFTPAQRPYYTTNNNMLSSTIIDQCQGHTATENSYFRTEKGEDKSKFQEFADHMPYALIIPFVDASYLYPLWKYEDDIDVNDTSNCCQGDDLISFFLQGHSNSLKNTPQSHMRALRSDLRLELYILRIKNSFDVYLGHFSKHNNIIREHLVARLRRRAQRCVDNEVTRCTIAATLPRNTVSANMVGQRSIEMEREGQNGDGMNEQMVRGVSLMNLLNDEFFLKGLSKTWAHPFYYSLDIVNTLEHMRNVYQDDSETREVYHLPGGMCAYNNNEKFIHSLDNLNHHPLPISLNDENITKYKGNPTINSSSATGGLTETEFLILEAWFRAISSAKSSASRMKNDIIGGGGDTNPREEQQQATDLLMNSKPVGMALQRLIDMPLCYYFCDRNENNNAISNRESIDDNKSIPMRNDSSSDNGNNEIEKSFSSMGSAEVLVDTTKERVSEGDCINSEKFIYIHPQPDDANDSNEEKKISDMPLFAIGKGFLGTHHVSMNTIRDFYQYCNTINPSGNNYKSQGAGNAQDFTKLLWDHSKGSANSLSQGVSSEKSHGSPHKLVTFEDQVPSSRTLFSTSRGGTASSQGEKATQREALDAVIYDIVARHVAHTKKRFLKEANVTNSKTVGQLTQSSVSRVSAFFPSCSRRANDEISNDMLNNPIYGSCTFVELLLFLFPLCPVKYILRRCLRMVLVDNEMLQRCIPKEIINNKMRVTSEGQVESEMTRKGIKKKEIVEELSEKGKIRDKFKIITKNDGCLDLSTFSSSSYLTNKNTPQDYNVLITEHHLLMSYLSSDGEAHLYESCPPPSPPQSSPHPPLYGQMMNQQALPQSHFFHSPTRWEIGGSTANATQHPMDTREDGQWLAGDLLLRNQHEKAIIDSEMEKMERWCARNGVGSRVVEEYQQPQQEMNNSQRKGNIVEEDIGLLQKKMNEENTELLTMTKMETTGLEEESKSGKSLHELFYLWIYIRLRHFQRKRSGQLFEEVLAQRKLLTEQQASGQAAVNPDDGGVDAGSILENSLIPHDDASVEAANLKGSSSTDPLLAQEEILTPPPCDFSERHIIRELITRNRVVLNACFNNPDASSISSDKTTMTMLSNRINQCMKEINTAINTGVGRAATLQPMTGLGINTLLKRKVTGDGMNITSAFADGGAFAGDAALQSSFSSFVTTNDIKLIVKKLDGTLTLIKEGKEAWFDENERIVLNYNSSLLQEENETMNNSAISVLKDSISFISSLSSLKGSSGVGSALFDSGHNEICINKNMGKIVCPHRLNSSLPVFTGLIDVVEESELDYEDFSVNPTKITMPRLVDDTEVIAAAQDADEQLQGSSSAAREGTPELSTALLSYTEITDNLENAATSNVGLYWQNRFHKDSQSSQLPAISELSHFPILSAEDLVCIPSVYHPAVNQNHLWPPDNGGRGELLPNCPSSHPQALMATRETTLPLINSYKELSHEGESHAASSERAESVELTTVGQDYENNGVQTGEWKKIDAENYDEDDMWPPGITNNNSDVDNGYLQNYALREKLNVSYISHSVVLDLLEALKERKLAIIRNFPSTFLYLTTEKVRADDYDITKGLMMSTSLLKSSNNDMDMAVNINNKTNHNQSHSSLKDDKNKEGNDKNTTQEMHHLNDLRRNDPLIAFLLCQQKKMADGENEKNCENSDKVFHYRYYFYTPPPTSEVEERLKLLQKTDWGKNYYYYEELSKTDAENEKDNSHIDHYSNTVNAQSQHPIDFPGYPNEDKNNSLYDEGLRMHCPLQGKALISAWLEKDLFPPFLFPLLSTKVKGNVQKIKNHAPMEKKKTTKENNGILPPDNYFCGTINPLNKNITKVTFTLALSEAILLWWNSLLDYRYINDNSINYLFGGTESNYNNSQQQSITGDVVAGIGSKESGTNNSSFSLMRKMTLGQLLRIAERQESYKYDWTGKNKHGDRCSNRNDNNNKNKADRKRPATCVTLYCGNWRINLLLLLRFVRSRTINGSVVLAAKNNGSNSHDGTTTDTTNSSALFPNGIKKLSHPTTSSLIQDDSDYHLSSLHSTILNQILPDVKVHIQSDFTLLLSAAPTSSGTNVYTYGGEESGSLALKPRTFSFQRQISSMYNADDDSLSQSLIKTNYQSENVNTILSNIPVDSIFISIEDIVSYLFCHHRGNEGKNMDIAKYEPRDGTRSNLSSTLFNPTISVTKGTITSTTMAGTHETIEANSSGNDVHVSGLSHLTDQRHYNSSPNSPNVSALLKKEFRRELRSDMEMTKVYLKSHNVSFDGINHNIDDVLLNGAHNKENSSKKCCHENRNNENNRDEEMKIIYEDSVHHYVKNGFVNLAKLPYPNGLIGTNIDIFDYSADDSEDYYCDENEENQRGHTLLPIYSVFLKFKRIDVSKAISLLRLGFYRIVVSNNSNQHVMQSNYNANQDTFLQNYSPFISLQSSSSSSFLMTEVKQQPMFVLSNTVINVIDNNVDDDNEHFLAHLKEYHSNHLRCTSEKGGSLLVTPTVAEVPPCVTSSIIVFPSHKGGAKKKRNVEKQPVSTLPNISYDQLAVSPTINGPSTDHLCRSSSSWELPPVFVKLIAICVNVNPIGDYNTCLPCRLPPCAFESSPFERDKNIINELLIPKEENKEEFTINSYYKLISSQNPLLACNNYLYSHYVYYNGTVKRRLDIMKYKHLQRILILLISISRQVIDYQKYFFEHEVPTYGPSGQPKLLCAFAEKSSVDLNNSEGSGSSVQPPPFNPNIVPLLNSNLLNIKENEHFLYDSRILHIAGLCINRATFDLSPLFLIPSGSLPLCGDIDGNGDMKNGNKGDLTTAAMATVKMLMFSVFPADSTRTTADSLLKSAILGEMSSDFHPSIINLAQFGTFMSENEDSVNNTGRRLKLMQLMIALDGAGINPKIFIQDKEVFKVMCEMVKVLRCGWGEGLVLGKSFNAGSNEVEGQNVFKGKYQCIEQTKKKINEDIIEFLDTTYVDTNTVTGIPPSSSPQANKNVTINKKGKEIATKKTVQLSKKTQNSQSSMVKNENNVKTPKIDDDETCDSVPLLEYINENIRLSDENSHHKENKWDTNIIVEKEVNNGQEENVKEKSDEADDFHNKDNSDNVINDNNNKYYQEEVNQTNHMDVNTVMVAQLSSEPIPASPLSDALEIPTASTIHPPLLKEMAAQLPAQQNIMTDSSGGVGTFLLTKTSSPQSLNDSFLGTPTPLSLPMGVEGKGNIGIVVPIDNVYKSIESEIQPYTVYNNADGGTNDDNFNGQGLQNSTNGEEQCFYTEHTDSHLHNFKEGSGSASLDGFFASGNRSCKSYFTNDFINPYCSSDNVTIYSGIYRNTCTIKTEDNSDCSRLFFASAASGGCLSMPFFTTNAYLAAKRRRNAIDRNFDLKNCTGNSKNDLPFLLDSCTEFMPRVYRDFAIVQYPRVQSNSCYYDPLLNLLHVDNIDNVVICKNKIDEFHATASEERNKTSAIKNENKSTFQHHHHDHNINNNNTEEVVDVFIKTLSVVSPSVRNLLGLTCLDEPFLVEENNNAATRDNDDRNDPFYKFRKVSKKKTAVTFKNMVSLYKATLDIDSPGALCRQARKRQQLCELPLTPALQILQKQTEAKVRAAAGAEGGHFLSCSGITQTSKSNSLSSPTQKKKNDQQMLSNALWNRVSSACAAQQNIITIVTNIAAASYMRYRFEFSGFNFSNNSVINLTVVGSTDAQRFNNVMTAAAATGNRNSLKEFLMAVEGEENFDNGVAVDKKQRQQEKERKIKKMGEKSNLRSNHNIDSCDLRSHLSSFEYFGWPENWDAYCVFNATDYRYNKDTEMINYQKKEMSDGKKALNYNNNSNITVGDVNGGRTPITNNPKGSHQKSCNTLTNGNNMAFDNIEIDDSIGNAVKNLQECNGTPSGMLNAICYYNTVNKIKASRELHQTMASMMATKMNDKGGSSFVACGSSMGHGDTTMDNNVMPLYCLENSITLDGLNSGRSNITRGGDVPVLCIDLVFPPPLVRMAATVSLWLSP